MPKRKHISVYANDRWLDHLRSIAPNLSAYVIQACEEKAAREGQPFPVAAIAPHGVRNDALPQGWKSRLYQNRYQLVAEYTASGFEIYHYHEYPKPVTNVFGVLEVIVPPAEVHVINVPVGVNKQDVANDVRWAVMEMGLT